MYDTMHYEDCSVDFKKIIREICLNETSCFTPSMIINIKRVVNLKNGYPESYVVVIADCAEIIRVKFNINFGIIAFEKECIFGNL
jgi:hypothetical protein